MLPEKNVDNIQMRQASPQNFNTTDKHMITYDSTPKLGDKNHPTLAYYSVIPE
ncbi:hydrogenase 2 small subunit, partial [Escherichia coli]